MILLSFCLINGRELYIKNPYPRDKPNVYQEMDWKIDSDAHNECKKDTNTFNPRIDVCMKNIFNMAKVGHFKIKPGSAPLELEFKLWKYEETPQNAKAYRLPCQGDSGASSWITNGYSKKDVYNFKYVIGSIVVRVHRWAINEIGMKGDVAPCGGVVLSELLSNAASSQKTTITNIFYWIKQKAEI